MPEHDFRFTALIQVLDNEALLAETLFFPEVSSLAEKHSDVRDALLDNVVYLTESLPPLELFRRHHPGPITVEPLVLLLDPPPRSAAWREPVELTLPTVRWTHGEEAHLAYIPALGIEVVASTPDDLARLLPQHARAALMRTKLLALHRLARLERCQRLEVEEFEATIDLPSPKRRAQLEASQEKADPCKTLKEVGTDLTTITLREAFEVHDIVTRVAETLTARSPRSVLLVGPSGVGKTAIVHELVRRRKELGLGSTPFWATSGSRLVAGQCGFGMWQQRVQELWREASRLRAILHLGNLMELLDVGKSEHRSQGIAAFLRPYLQRGDLLVLAECLPEQKPLIERQDPHLLQSFVEIAIEEPGPQRGQAILTGFALAAAEDRPRGAPFPIQGEALDTIDALHRRYATYSAYPGRPLRFLHNLLIDLPRDRVLTRADVTAAFSRETGLPLFLLEDSIPLDLARTRDWFRARVLGQPEAIDLIVDLLATVKARLTRPRKPLASLLFIGPTGVGKTELAKALAEFLFGSRDRLTRYDMSEYADPLAVQRLIGGGPFREGLLTAKVREQPFSVVLLDEFEKADPQLFDLLLQVLGEGRLTDASGRLADFCNSVVIMTSNLGAVSYQQGRPGFGASSEASTEQQRVSARDHFVREVQAFLRPELFNRIDRIIPFSPLDSNTILEIARLQLALIRQRDGIRYRGVTLEVEEEVTRWLAGRGFDARYGARPLKRAMERELLAPLAARMNQYTAETPLRAEVSLEGDALQLRVRARSEDHAVQAGTEAAVALECVELRRDLQALQRCSAVREIVNEIFRLERIEERLRKGNKPRNHEDVESLARLSPYRRLRDLLAEQLRQACDREDAVLVALHCQELIDVAGQTLAVAEARKKFEQLLLEVYVQQFDEPDRITLALFAEQPDQLWNLAEAYYEVVWRKGGECELWQFLPEREGRDRDSTPLRRLVLEPDRLFRGTRIRVRDWDRKNHTWAGPDRQVDVREGVIGLGMRIKMPLAFPLFAREQGLHHVIDTRAGGRCLVDTSNLPLFGATEDSFYLPPSGIERKGAVGGQKKRRLYQPERGLVEDLELGEKLSWDGRSWADLLAMLMQRRLLETARGLLDR